MKNQILKNAAILGFSGICAKSFDFAFRAFYSRSLGAEGMGLLSLGFGLHGVMLPVSTAGLGVAVSKIVSEYLEQKDYGAVRQSMKLAVYGVACLSLAVILLTLLGAEWIAANILGDRRVATSLCCLVPSILFMGISYCLKGYFYAARKAVIPASSEFLEQAVKFAAISLLLKWFLPKGISYGCTAVFCGISIGEFSSCLYLSLFFRREAKKLKACTLRKGILGSILKISFPSMLSSLAGSTLRMQEEVWIVAAFKRFGMSHAAAVSNLGIIHGMVMPMLVFPLTLAGSVTTLLVPEIARANTAADKRRLHKLIRRVYQAGLAAGFCVLAVFQVFPDQLSQMIYHEPAIAPMVRQLSLLCPLMFVDSLSCAVLNGLGNQFSMLFYNISDSLLRLSGIFVFVPLYGMPALLGVIAVSNLFTCTLTFRKVVKTSGFGRRLAHLGFRRKMPAQGRHV